MNTSSRIAGKERLIRNGQSAEDQRARRLCLQALEAALDAINPEKCVRKWLKLDGDRFRIGDFSAPSSTKIRLLAVGKASVPMLKGALAILGKRVISGILVAPKRERIAGLDKRIVAFRTGHPIPDGEGVRASRYVTAVVSGMHSDELLLCLISGGASAMLPAPVDGVSLDEKKEITQQLIRSRATIHEVNTVRRHLSKLKGGSLVKLCTAGGMVSLIISDVPGNPLSDIASGLTAPDPTTFRDAINVLKEFDLWNSTPRSVRNRFNQGLAGNISDTPKPADDIFRKVHNVIIADNRTACEAAEKTLEKTHTPTTVLTSSLDMEARSLGRLLASIAKDSETFRQPIRRPGALVVGGETTVDVKGNGIGGRNQEVALAALPRIATLKGTAIAAIGTDGIDGNSPAAGALIDGGSMARAVRVGLHVQKFEARNDSYNFFTKLGDSIITGRTGTNVSDIYLLVLAL